MEKLNLTQLAMHQ